MKETKMNTKNKKTKKWKDLPDYIIGVTNEIWEQRGVHKLNQYYHKNIIVRTPMGSQFGNQEVIASTIQTINEFPDRQLFAEDVIWDGNKKDGFLSSHRITTTATHTGNGMFGNATNKKIKIQVIADCAVKNDVIYDEWLVRDYGGMVRQLGIKPKEFAKKLILREGGAKKCSKPLNQTNNPKPIYKKKGNKNKWGEKYVDTIRQLMEKNGNVVEEKYDRAVVGNYPGAKEVISYDEVGRFWFGLRAAFPDAKFQVHHQIGMDGDMLPPRASVRWSLNGKHSGWGAFGKPTGANVYVMGIAHAEFGPFGETNPTIRRECCLYDEVAVWKQILIQKGE